MLGDVKVFNYEWLSTINNRNFEDKSVLIIGAGVMAKEYALALSMMKVKNVTILSRSEQRTVQLSKKYNFKAVSGGFEKNLSSLEIFDLVIIATPVELLIPAAKRAIEAGQKNILIEKPVSLFCQEIEALIREITHMKIRVGFNRTVYPNFHKLKELSDEDGGITSCRYSFTEWIHQIDFEKFSTEILSRWGIANSIHVISMAHELIGLPIKIESQQLGQFDWHPSGAVFSGLGITDKNIPFSYHSDWKAPGRWGVEIMTQENAYSLMPLEKLFYCPKNSVKWEEVQFRVAYPNVKLGIAEEIGIMLDEKTDQKPDLVTLDKAIDYCKLSEEIFGYNKTSTNSINSNPTHF